MTNPILAMLRKDSMEHWSAAGVETALVASRAMDCTPRETNLPVQRTTFIGRDQELSGDQGSVAEPRSPYPDADRTWWNWQDSPGSAMCG